MCGRLFYPLLANYDAQIDIEHCSYLVDSYFPNLEPTTLQPNHVLDDGNWEQLRCSNFLDASQTNIIGRIFYVPPLDLVPERFRRKWGRQCLLRKRSLPAS